MARKLFTDEEISRLRKLFQTYDKDNSAAITPAEAQLALKEFGIPVTDEQVSRIFSVIDTNQSGTIEFVEFLKFSTFAKEESLKQASAAPAVKSRDFPAPVASTNNSDIVINVIQGRNLPKTDLIQKIDPYFIFKYGSVEKKTDTKKNTTDPVYNETITLPAGAGNQILVQLYDWDRFSKNDLIGSFVLDISRYNKYPQQKWYPITTVNGKPAGELELAIVNNAVQEAAAPVPASVPEEPVLKSRAFEPAPSPDVALPVELLPNGDASGNITTLNSLPLTLKNNLPLTAPCAPYNLVVNQQLGAGNFQIVLISELDPSAWGRWAGVVGPQNVGLDAYHIVGNNALDHHTAQISTLGVKTGGVWQYRIPNYVEPAGRVELVVELQNGKLRAAWNGYVLPHGVENIPQGVRFNFELPNSLVLTIKSLTKLQAPTLQTQAGHIDYKW